MGKWSTNSPFRQMPAANCNGRLVPRKARDRALLEKYRSPLVPIEQIRYESVMEGLPLKNWRQA
jgi:hypothetical protein